MGECLSREQLPAANFDSSETSLLKLMQQLPGFLWTTDKDLQITSTWGAGLSVDERRPVVLEGRSVSEFLGCTDQHEPPIAAHHEALRGMTCQFEHSWNGRLLEVRVSPLRTAAGEIIGCVAMALDITRRKKTEEQALYCARHDALTGLANYREFMDRLELEVRRADRSHHSFTLLLLDLDQLKRINDLYGHLTGNFALKRLAAVMREHCRATDLAARYGGDEFAVLIIDSDRGMADNVASRIERRLLASEEKPPLSVSIGVGVYPDDGRSPAELIEAADERLYQRKKSSNTRAVSAR